MGFDDERRTLEFFLSTVMGEFGPEALPALIEALGRPGYHHVAITQAIGSLGHEGRDAVPALVARLQDADAIVRGFAARALAQIGVAAADVIVSLQTLLEDQDQWVREEAARAIESLRKD